jgi:hypothetical protein
MSGVSLSKTSDSAGSGHVLVPPSVEVGLLLESPLDPLPELLESAGAFDPPELAVPVPPELEPPVELLASPDPVAAETPLLDVLLSFPDPGGWVPEWAHAMAKMGGATNQPWKRPRFPARDESGMKLGSSCQKSARGPRT